MKAVIQEKTNSHSLSTDNISNIIIVIEDFFFFGDADLLLRRVEFFFSSFFLEKGNILLHWSSKLAFPFIKSVANGLL